MVVALLSLSVIDFFIVRLGFFIIFASVLAVFVVAAVAVVVGTIFIQTCTFLKLVFLGKACL